MCLQDLQSCVVKARRDLSGSCWTLMTFEPGLTQAFRAKGSVESQSTFWCCNGDCCRRGYVDIDGIGFFCYVCCQRVENEAALAQLKLSKSKNTPFENHLGVNVLAMMTLDFLLGSGWEDQCPCCRCKRSWLECGWICPANYNHRWSYHCARMVLQSTLTM